MNSIVKAMLKEAERTGDVSCSLMVAVPDGRYVHIAILIDAEQFAGVSSSDLAKLYAQPALAQAQARLNVVS